MECLKAEWLYSQGRGRKFHVGQHEELVEYLSQQSTSSQQTTCNGGTGGSGEDEKKLRLVLSKAQMYQQQLKQERMYGNDPELMTRSLDPYILQGVTHHTKPEVPSDLALSRSIAGPVSSCINVPLPTATTLLPVPESLPSPLITSLPSLPSSTSTSKLSITQEEDFSLSSSGGGGGSKQLRGIHRTVLNRKVQQGQIEAERRGSLDLVQGQLKVERRRSQGHLDGERRRESFERQDSTASHSNSRDSTDNAVGFLMDEHQAAVCIQKFWRGYKARNLDSNVVRVCQTIQTQRINKYVHQLVADMAATREALACEHQLQVLQLQAINALWNKMVTQEPCNVQRCACLSSSIQYEITSLKNVCEELKNQ
ncbi:hypothetical protein WDU94_012053, partial [Cyamophila willieti]